MIEILGIGEICKGAKAEHRKLRVHRDRLRNVLLTKSICKFLIIRENVISISIKINNFVISLDKHGK